MNDSLRTYAAGRDELLARIVQILSADARCVAAWLTGSFGRGEADAVSDLDLSVVIADEYSAALCARSQQVNAGTTPERYELFSKFDRPVLIHENHHNAPPGGTFTAVLYTPAVVMVDWTLIPLAQAQRPPLSRLLFDRVGIPVGSDPTPEGPERRAAAIADRTAFFWMMAAITAKYIIRGDGVFVTCWLEELYKMVEEVERLLAGAAWRYRRGSRSVLEPTRADQAKALLQLCRRMANLAPQATVLCGHPMPDGLPAVQTLLNLTVGM